jgi:hypothetical protein
VSLYRAPQVSQPRLPVSSAGTGGKAVPAGQTTTRSDRTMIQNGPDRAQQRRRGRVAVGRDVRYPADKANLALRLGVNVTVYAMTH